MIKLMQKKVYELYKKFLVTITFSHYLTIFLLNIGMNKEIK